MITDSIATRERRTLVIVFVALCLGLAACGSGNTTAGNSPTGLASSAVTSNAELTPSSALSTNGLAASSQLAFTGQDEVAWQYSGDNGPDDWGKLEPGCNPGDSGSQSPIDIETADLKRTATPADDALTISYLPTVFEVNNTGRTIEAVPDDPRANFITVDGVNFYLLQFHLHNPSEHTIDSTSFGMELHLVNKSDDGALAVLGVLMNGAQENTALAELFANIPTTKTDEQSAVELSEKINPTDLIPVDSEVARYSGSLTTPPCSEPVIWSVFLTPSAVSDSQLAALTSIFPGNHRPTQPLNGRTVTEISSTVQ